MSFFSEVRHEHPESDILPASHLHGYIYRDKTKRRNEFVGANGQKDLLKFVPASWRDTIPDDSHLFIRNQLRQDRFVYMFHPLF